ncbi:MAG: hypothetical protein IKG23_01445 [Clostridia bacterium]|nr:hypothetical protein [Clostridia bacterium]
MSKASAAYVTCVVAGKTYTYHFTGVTSIEHNLALNLNNEASEGADIVNGARNLANQVTLSVVETDTEQAAGWAARMLEAMAALKKQRILCKVATSMATYEDMLLTEIVATQDEENQFGWSGSLAFMEYIPVTEENAESVKTNDNSSVRKNTGSAGKIAITPLQQMLARAGIK